ncbi:TPA: hypothetical protein ACH3X1_015662 [Trebouxia sp. C0004]
MLTLSASSILTIHADCTTQNPEDCSIKEELAKELMQQSLGHFDPAKLYLDPQFGSQNTIANYVGPLKVINIPGKGRGIIVTKAVKPGTLLAVGKPLGINMGIHGLIDSLTQSGSNSKQALQCIYALCEGTKQSVANVPDVQIFASNGTECLAHTDSVDSSKIAHIVKHNCFLTGGGRADEIVQTNILLYNKKPQPMAYVLYGVLSLVNHSCCPNSTYHILNEAAVLRAVKILHQEMKLQSATVGTYQVKETYGKGGWEGLGSLHAPAPAVQLKRRCIGKLGA